MTMIVHDSNGQIYNESEIIKYLSSEIMELEKNEGRGTHFGILSY